MPNARRLTSLEHLSCSTICFRSFALKEALAAIESIGFTSVDIGTMPGFCPHFDFMGASAEDEHSFLQTLRESPLRINTFTTLIGHANDPDVDPAMVIKAGIRNVRVAREAGATGIVLNCGAYRDRAVHPFEQDLETVAGVIRKIAAEAVNEGIRPLVEAPHKGLFVRTPAEARQLVERVNIPQFGLILDINHYEAAGWSPREAVEFVGASEIGIVHLRDGEGGENRMPLGAGRIDFRKLLDALENGGYSGMCSFEFSDTTGNLEGDIRGVRESVEYLRSL